MNTNVFKMSALALCIGAGAVNTANAANAYAYHETSLLDGFVIVTSGTIFLTQGNNTSQAAASLNGVGPTGSDIGLGVRDVPQQKAGAVTAGENDFSPQGRSPSSNFSRGDAQVIQEQAPGVPVPGQGIFVSSVSESNVNGNNNAAASATNSSASLVLDIQVGPTGGTINFILPVDVTQRIAISPTGIPPASKAESILQASVEITNGLGAKIFQWTPDGLAGGISGGTEVSDPYSLNRTLTTLIPGADITPAGTTGGVFEANTNFIAPGAYTLSLSLGGEDSVIIASPAVPEPGSLAMLGLGLVSLAGASARRRKKAS